MSNNNTTQLTKASGYDPKKNMTFQKFKTSTIPGSTFTFKRIQIGTRNPDGSFGDLVIETPRVYSFGLSENRNQTTKQLEGYSLPLCLQSRNGPTEEETQFLATYNAIVECARLHVLSVKAEIGKPKLHEVELSSMGALYQKKDEQGDPVDGSGPVLYPKIWQQKKKTGKPGKNDPPSTQSSSSSSEESDTEMITQFVDENGNDIVDYKSLVGRHSYAKAAIRIDSIFIGAKVNSLQIKVQEAEISVIGATRKRLLSRPVADSTVSMPSSMTMAQEPSTHSSSSSTSAPSNSFQSLQTNEDEDGGGNDDTGSLHGGDSDAEDDHPAPTTVAAKPATTTSKAPARRVAAKK